jgi:hypothetical protein
MTVIYVHGVKVRSAEHGVQLGKSFRRWLSPKLSVDNDVVGYEPVFWGDLAASFRWNLASRPPTKLLGMGGAADFAGLGSLRGAPEEAIFDVVASQEVVAGPVIGVPTDAKTPSAPPLASVPVSNRPDFLADLYLACLPARRDPIVEAPELAGLAAAAAAVASRWDAIAAEEEDDDALARRLVAEVDAELRGGSVIGMGGIADWIERADEVLRRAAVWPGDVVGTLAGEARPKLNEFVAYFVGDVFTYLIRRGDRNAVGPIPTRILQALRVAQKRKRDTGEKIVVVSHSMGGQLVYDALTYFCDGDESLADIEVDHWITCGSQVSLFAEMQLFLGQPDAAAGAKLPMPARVKAWTNFYDTNDLVGFVMAPVFEGVSDREYDTGYGLLFAHTGFLARPSFYRAVADLL